MQANRQESSLKQRLGFVQEYHKNYPNTSQTEVIRQQPSKNLKLEKEQEEQPKLSLKDNLNRISNLYKAVSQPRLKETNVQIKKPCQIQSVSTKAVKENQNIRTFLNQNQLSLKDYDWKQGANRGFENKISRTDSVINQTKKVCEVSFLKGVF